MNKALSLSKLVDEAAYLQDESSKNLSGSITDPENFERNASALESLHRGSFSFIAFHPRTDPAVAEYIERGSLASDSGPNILVLFFSAAEMRFPRNITPNDVNLGVTLDTEVHPAYQFTERLFPTGVRPKLPGLLFFDHVLDANEAVYVPILKQSTAIEVGDFCRSVFILVDDVVKRHKPWERVSFDDLSTTLKSKGIEYSRTGETSIGEWLIVAYGFAKKNAGTIVSVVSKIAK